MIIIADKEGKGAIESMADVALKTGGLQNLMAVQQILTSIKEYVPPKPEKDNGEDKNVQ